VTIVAVDNLAFPGRYQGQGSWIDIAGESNRYRVTQEISGSASTPSVASTRAKVRACS